MAFPQQCIKCLGMQHWSHAYEMLRLNEDISSIRVAAEYTYVDDEQFIEWEWLLYRDNGVIMKRILRGSAIVEDAPY